ncbi:ferredoxin [Streptomyces sp. NPDC026206]|uniref:ferredoxin n=1 Tax=Streptomyces sp. NPDC026206 TaxID=3157089 RepID=UPI0034005887
MRITVDTDRCVGAGQCVLTAPAVFDQDDDGLVVVLNPEPDDSETEAVRQADDLCPARTITVHED